MHQTTCLRRLALLAVLAIVALAFMPSTASTTARAMPAAEAASAAATPGASQQPCPDTLAYKSCLGLMPPAYGLIQSGPSIQSVSGAPDAPFLNAAASTPTGSWPQVLAPVDMAQTGRSSAAIATDRYFDAANDRQLHLFDMPSGVFARAQQLAAGADPEAAVALDADLDGRSDVVVALAGDNALALYRHGATQPLSDAVRLPALGGPDALAAGDFDGDLHPDLAAAAPLSDTIRFWRSSPQGLRPMALKLPYATAGFDALAVGDFNSDGQDDLAALRGAGYASDSVVVYLQDRGAFPVTYTLSPETGGYLPNSLAAGDVNGDGRDDLVVTAGGNAPSAYVNVFLQAIKDAAAVPVTYGLLATPKTLPAYHLPSAVAIGDLNHDGRDDVALLNDAWRTLSVYTQTLTADLSPYAAADAPYSSRYRPNALALADFDGNGGLDVALVGRDTGLTVLTNKISAPTAVITQPLEAATLSPGAVTIAGTASATAARVQVRIRGLTDWMDASLSGAAWQLNTTLPIQQRAWWFEARAIDAQGHVQAPPARRRVRVETVCYAVADNDGRTSSPDRLMLIGMATAGERLIGDTGTEHIEALAFQPGSATLYAANARQLGTLNLSTGVFSATAALFGKGSGARGSITFNDVDGLAFDATGALYATQRRGRQGEKDLLFKVDPTTGAHVPAAFGAKLDYVEIKGSGVPDDVDDIAFDPMSGVMYGVANTGGKGDTLITVNLGSGLAAVVGRLGANDIEGLGFTGDGRLYATSGHGGDSATRDRLYAIDKRTGATILVGPFSQQQDYESLSCPAPNIALPLPPGLQAPHVDDFTIAAGTSTTASPSIALEARSTGLGDNAPRWMLFVEYGYDAQTGGWAPVQPTLVRTTDWKPYAGGATRYPWQLRTAGGVAYIQAWAANAAGQISAFPFQAFINHLPSSDSLTEGQARIYRYTLRAGDQITVHLDSLQGDADLYLWPPDSDVSGPIVSNLRGAADEINILAPMDGLYQIEVRGYSATTYRLTIETSANSNPALQTLATGGVDATKPQPTQPAVPVDNAPSLWQPPQAKPSALHLRFIAIVRD